MLLSSSHAIRIETRVALQKRFARLLGDCGSDGRLTAILKSRCVDQHFLQPKNQIDT